MGADGGTIPTRCELVKTRERPEKKDKDSERLFRWRHCNLSQEPLSKPVVACQMGKLYNKEAVVKMLLDRNTGAADANQQQSHAAVHIRGLKDVRELQLTPNPAHTAKAVTGGDGNGYMDKSSAPWICPLTGLEMNGKFRFVFDWTDGRVMSERACKMLADDEEGRILAENCVIINPAEEAEQALMASRMGQRKAKAKKAKKRTKEQAQEDTTSKAKTVKKEEKSKDDLASRTKKDLMPGKSSIQSDPTKSEVYKSLFVSHPTAQNKPKGNWVTFDPRYN